MKKYIYKYKLNLTDITELKFKGYYQIVRIAYQDDDLTVWIEITEYANVEKILQLSVFGTGHSIPLSLTHVGSVESPNRVFVWHVYANHS